MVKFQNDNQNSSQYFLTSRYCNLFHSQFKSFILYMLNFCSSALRCVIRVKVRITATGSKSSYQQSSVVRVMSWYHRYQSYRVISLFGSNLGRPDFGNKQQEARRDTDWPDASWVVFLLMFIYTDCQEQQHHSFRQIRLWNLWKVVQVAIQHLNGALLLLGFVYVCNL